MGGETPEDRHALAKRHVETGRRIIERQRQIVAETKARKVDSTQAEELLAQFERTQAIFEDDLALIIGKKN